jgi:hypothetical protein
LAAGLKAVNETIPDVITDEKEAKKARMEIDKAMGNIEEATRLEKKGDWEGSTAEKEKAASRMQALNVKFIEFQEVEQKTQAAENRANIRGDIELKKVAMQDTHRLERERELRKEDNASAERVANIRAGVEHGQLTEAKLQTALQASLHEFNYIDIKAQDMRNKDAYTLATSTVAQYKGKTEPLTETQQNLLTKAQGTIKETEDTISGMKKRAGENYENIRNKVQGRSGTNTNFDPEKLTGDDKAAYDFANNPKSPGWTKEKADKIKKELGV